MKKRMLLPVTVPVVLLCVVMTPWALAQDATAAATEMANLEGVAQPLRDQVLEVVAKVKPALVRIQVVSADYQDGREVKYDSAGSGIIITPEGHVVTNHHVAGHATRLLVTLANKEEVEAELVGTDALTDIAVIKLDSSGARTYPTAEFGDSSTLEVGDRVLAMGSPRALSQSVTLGIVSNTELVMPRILGPRGRFTLDGEDVGSFVRWIGHDAAIYPGNSGGPLVDLNGRIVGINEISMSLGGAIPSNVAKVVAERLIAEGKVTRAWLGLEVQPLLKHSTNDRGVLVSGTLEGGPAATGGVQSGDILVKVADQDVQVRFDEEIPAFNRLVAELPIGKPVSIVVLRGGQELTLEVTPSERGEMAPKQEEFKQWGITGRNLSYMIAKEMKRDTTNGVLVTSVRPGGPAGGAKPKIAARDVIIKVNDTPINNVEDLRRVTEMVTEGKDGPTPVFVSFDRRAESSVTVVRVGIKELEDPGREVKKAWLPVRTQVITRDIAQQMGDPKLRGFRVTEVYPSATAEGSGLKVGDYIVAVDDIPLTASEEEHYEELPTLIRQYKLGTTAQLKVIRDGQPQVVPVVLDREPQPSREMKKYRDELFEFTTRDVTFFDIAEEKWPKDQKGALVDEITPGSWAALGDLYVGDLILSIDGTPIENVEGMKARMDQVAAEKPKSVVFKVLRGIHTLYLEIMPKWTNGEV